MSESNAWLGKHAIVIGGSIGGLLTARVLSEYFQRVTLIERDAIPETPTPRKSVPQGNHVHVVFGGGIKVINRLYPGFFEELQSAGSTKCDFSRDLCWYQMGVWKARPESDLSTYWQSRPFLEAHLRDRTKRDTDVQFLEQCGVVGLVSDAQRTRVCGVEIQRRDSSQEPERLEADLVIDAGGRGSQTPKWLESLGYTKPKEKTVEVNIGYASRMYEPSEDDKRDWKILAVFGTPPLGKCSGYIFPIEGNRWLVSLVGIAKNYAPGDDDAHLEFARSMEVPDLYDAIKNAKPLTPISCFKFPANRWRRYDKLSRFPGGLLVIGDAICSFNPVYGQGMSVCAMEVEELGRMLERCRGRGKMPECLARDFFRNAEKIIATAWMLATQSDFLYPQTVGSRPLHTHPLNWYLIRVLQLCSGSEPVVKAFYEVLHFVKQPTSLFHPRIIWRVLGRGVGLKGSYRPSKDRPQLPTH